VLNPALIALYSDACGMLGKELVISFIIIVVTIIITCFHHQIKFTIYFPSKMRNVFDKFIFNFDDDVDRAYLGNHFFKFASP
jgi:hypothetical protein